MLYYAAVFFIIAIGNSYRVIATTAVIPTK